MRFTHTLLLGASISALSLCGCQEKVVDVETPMGDVEVIEDTTTGDVTVEVEAPAEE